MKTILYIIVACYLLKRSGLIKRFLNRLKLPEETATPEVYQEPTRQELQADVIYILESKGLTTDNVKYMSNRILTEIIQDYYESR